MKTINFKSVILLVVTGIAGFAVASCGDDNLLDSDAELTRIELSPSNIELEKGSSTTVTAYLVDAGGRRISVDPSRFSLKWSVSDSAVLQLHEDGIVANVTAVSSGAAYIEASVSADASIRRVFGARSDVFVRRRATRLVVSAGSDQTASIRSTLSGGLRLRALDETSEPVAAVPITWTVVSGGGTVVATAPRTEDLGYAGATWTLGPNMGPQIVRASYGLLAADFSATAVAGMATQIVRVSGDAQTGLVSARLADSLAVRVSDQDGNPVAGATVAWSILAGGGSLTPNQSISNGQGIARAAWTLGSSQGTAVSRAWVEAGEVRFSATAEPSVVTPPSPAVTRLAVAPDLVTLNALGAQTTLIATAYNGSGQIVSNPSLTWTSLNSMVATVDAVGRVTARAAGTALIVTLAVCCSQADTTAVVVSPVIAALSMSPRTGSIQVGGVLSLTALAYDANGNAITTSVAWSSSNSGVASVASGLVTGITAGTAIIRSSSGAFRDSAVITVVATPVPPPTPPTVASVSVSPATNSLVINSTVQLGATVRDANGTTLSGHIVAWSTSNSAVATVNASGLVSALAAGSATITASTAGKTGTAQITVTTPIVTPTVSTVTLAPTAPSLLVGATVQLTPTARDANGTTMTGQAFTWSTSNGAVASVTNNGLVTGSGAGSAVITASTGGKSGTVQVTVTAPVVTPAPVATVTVTPTAPTLTAGGTQQFTATLKDANGVTLTGRTVTWATSNPTVATVSAGLVAALVPGSAVITATSEGKNGTTTVSVIASGTYALPDLATHNFDDGTLGPYSNPYSVVSPGDLTIVTDPTGAGRGKVAKLHYYIGAAPGSHLDHNLAFAYSPSTGGPGQSIYFRGDFYFDAFAPGTEAAARKILYCKGPTGNLVLFGVIGGPNYKIGMQSYDGVTINTINDIVAVGVRRWHTMEVQMTMNTPGTANGTVRIWLDGVLSGSWTNISMLRSSSERIDRCLVGQQVDRSGPVASFTVNENRYWDRVAFSTKRIGP